MTRMIYLFGEMNAIQVKVYIVAFRTWIRRSTYRFLAYFTLDLFLPSFLQKHELMVMTDRVFNSRRWGFNPTNEIHFELTCGACIIWGQKLLSTKITCTIFRWRVISEQEGMLRVTRVVIDLYWSFRTIFMEPKPYFYELTYRKPRCKRSCRTWFLLGGTKHIHFW